MHVMRSHEFAAGHDIVGFDDRLGSWNDLGEDCQPSSDGVPPHLDCSTDNTSKDLKIGKM